MNNSNQKIRWQNYTSSTVLLVVGILIFIGLCIYLWNVYKTLKNKIVNSNATIAYTTCPDYWDSIGNGKCQNVNSLGSCSKTADSNIMDFSSEIFTNNNTGNYAKCKWAKACNISWSNIDKLC